MKRLDDKRTIRSADPSSAERPARIELRGASGRLYGIFDPQALTIEFKFKRDEPAERIDLRKLIEPGI